jgi:hyperosmotically inducible protein
MLTTHSFRKRLLVAGVIAAFAAVPMAQAAAQGSPAQQAMSHQSESNRTVPDKVADSWITTKVKSEFAATKHVNATDISVSTVDGVVTLTGTVPSKQVKAKAVRIAHKVKGVKSVNDAGLTVGSTQTKS